MSGRGRGRGNGRGSGCNNKGRGSGGTSNEPQNNHNDNNVKPEKVEFVSHCTCENQGITHDTVKKEVAHDIKGEHKFGNDLAESLETGNQCKDKDSSWKHLGLAETTFVDNNNPTQLEIVDCMEFAKERNKRFRVHQDNGKKAHSTMQTLQ